MLHLSPDDTGVSVPTEGRTVLVDKSVLINSPVFGDLSLCDFSLLLCDFVSLQHDLSQVLCDPNFTAM